MKSGLKTFPLAVDIDDEIKLIETEFGLKGFAIAIKVFQAIYSKGYYMKWDIDTMLLFIRDYQLSVEGRGLVSEVVASMLRRGVLDYELHKKYGILTSSRIQETFLTANSRTKEVRFEKSYALPIVYSFIQNASNNGKNVNILFKNADIFEQRKGKERKEKNTHNAHAHEGDYLSFYDELFDIVKSVCPELAKRQQASVDQGNTNSISDIERYLETAELSRQELTELFTHVNKTYIIKPKFINCTVWWVLNNIAQVKAIPPDNVPAAAKFDKKNQASEKDKAILEKAFEKLNIE